MAVHESMQSALWLEAGIKQIMGFYLPKQHMSYDRRHSWDFRIHFDQLELLRAANLIINAVTGKQTNTDALWRVLRREMAERTRSAHTSQ